MSNEHEIPINLDSILNAIQNKVSSNCNSIEIVIPCLSRFSLIDFDIRGKSKPSIITRYDKQISISNDFDYDGKSDKNEFLSKYNTLNFGFSNETRSLRFVLYYMEK